MKAFLVPIVLIATSFFYFPFYFTFLPTVNTKMMMAALGLVVLLVKLGRDGHGYVSKDFLCFHFMLWESHLQVCWQ